MLGIRFSARFRIRRGLPWPPAPWARYLTALKMLSKQVVLCKDPLQAQLGFFIRVIRVPLGCQHLGHCNASIHLPPSWGTCISDLLSFCTNICQCLWYFGWLWVLLTSSVRHRALGLVASVTTVPQVSIPSGEGITKGRKRWGQQFLSSIGS